MKYRIVPYLGLYNWYKIEKLWMGLFWIEIGSYYSTIEEAEKTIEFISQKPIYK